jgi:hypothetical protein
MRNKLLIAFKLQGTVEKKTKNKRQIRKKLVLDRGMDGWIGLDWIGWKK